MRTIPSQIMIKNKTIEQVRTCECGCGQIVKKRFVSGHNRRGKKNGMKWHQAIRQANSGVGNAAKRVDVRKKISEALTGVPLSEERRKAISKSLKGNPRVIEARKGNTCRLGTQTSETALRNIALGSQKRRDRGGVWGISGWQVLERLGVKLFYRSTWERDFLIKLDREEKVKNVIVGRPLITYLVEGRKHIYIPDFKITLVSGDIVIVEVKPKYMLQDKKVRVKINAGHRYAQENKCIYQVWTEDVLNDKNGVTTMLAEAIQSATATAQKGRRYSLNSVVTQRGKEKSLTRQIGVKV